MVLLFNTVMLGILGLGFKQVIEEKLNKFSFFKYKSI